MDQFSFLMIKTFLRFCKWQNRGASPHRAQTTVIEVDEAAPRHTNGEREDNFLGAIVPPGLTCGHGHQLRGDVNCDARWFIATRGT
jgi:hypothetical protein